MADVFVTMAAVGMVVDPATSWNLNLWVNNHASYILTFGSLALHCLSCDICWRMGGYFQVSKAGDYPLPDID